ncbi:hypothetical protein [Rickettsia tamurae]|uniref:hypothetical protein n=1 Tax=Rickettsia tamurae TaxID=334545 RepID=UPI0013788708|nr:hypothetical protein [Rickettsia tamurae]
MTLQLIKFIKVVAAILPILWLKESRVAACWLVIVLPFSLTLARSASLVIILMPAL